MFSGDLVILSNLRRKLKMKFSFPVTPVPMARPRVVHYGRRVHTFIPKKQKVFMNEIGQLAKMQYNGQPIKKRAIKVKCLFYRPIPKSFSKKKQKLALNNTFKPITKPDVDNYLKILIDACTGIIWIDDNLITEMVAIKRYSDQPRIEMEVEI